MVKLTMIARVTDGLPLAEGLDDGRDINDIEFYKQQAKALFKNLSRGQNAPSRMSIETGPYVFKYPFVTVFKLGLLIFRTYTICLLDVDLSRSYFLRLKISAEFWYFLG